MADDGVGQRPAVEFLEAEEKRGFLWNLTDVQDHPINLLQIWSNDTLPVQNEMPPISKRCPTSGGHAYGTVLYSTAGIKYEY